MATTETLFVLTPDDYTPPTTLYAVRENIADLSTPPLLTDVLQFPTTPDWWAYWLVTVPSNYSGGGFRFSWKGGSDTTNAGTLELEFGIKKLADAVDLTTDLGLDGATRTAVTETPGGVANELNYTTTGDVSHANAGSPAVGDRLAIISKRDTVTDTNSGQLNLAEITVSEI